MTTLVALESPAQVDYLPTLREVYIPDDDRTYVVHAPTTPGGEEWSSCQNKYVVPTDSWEFHFARGEETPACRLVEFARGHAVGRIILIALN